MAKRVITFGEIMLRLAPEGYYRFVQANSFGATYGGGEANVAVSLANFGIDTAFVTKLPAHEIGQAAVNELRKFGVDTSRIVRGGNRIGIYFLEKGASQRPSKVIYDRKHSAICQTKPEDFDYLTYYENSTYSKPNPKYFKSLLEKFNLKPEEVVLFGNNTLEDGDCSAACGIRCFLVKGNIIYDPKAMGSYPEISMSEVIPTMESLLTE